jgi:hypothetical protein
MIEKLETWRWDLVGGIPTPLKNILVTWDDDIPILLWKNNPYVPKHQPVEN